MSIASTMARLDQALARNVALEVEAKNAHIRARQHYAQLQTALEELETCKAQAKLAEQTAKELMRMVDQLRGERDHWRGVAGR